MYSTVNGVSRKYVDVRSRQMLISSTTKIHRNKHSHNNALENHMHSIFVWFYIYKRRKKNVLFFILWSLCFQLCFGIPFVNHLLRKCLNSLLNLCRRLGNWRSSTVPPLQLDERVKKKKVFWNVQMWPLFSFGCLRRNEKKKLSKMGIQSDPSFM